MLSGETGLRLGTDAWLWLLTGLAACPSCSGERGDVLRANGLVGGVSSTGEVVTSWRTSWAVRGNWADTGDLNGLESFSLHRAIWMPGEPLEGVLSGRDVVGEHREGEVV